MKTLKTIILTGFVLLGTTFSLNIAAWDANTTINHLQQAQTELKAGILGAAEEHMKISRQEVKGIIGGSLEVKAQRGSNLINKALRQAKSGDSKTADATLEEALEIFKAIHEASKAGRGGLN